MPEPVTHVASTSVIGQSASPTVPKPAGLAEGDLMVGFYSSRQTTSFTPPAGWTSIGEVSRSTDATCHAFWKFVEAGDPSSWVGSATSSRFYGVGVIGLRDVDPDVPIVDSESNSGGDTTLEFPSLTFTEPGSMLLGGCATVATSTTAPSGTTERFNFGSGSGGQRAGNGWTLPVGEGDSPVHVGTISGGTVWALFSVGVRPVPGDITPVEDADAFTFTEQVRLTRNIHETDSAVAYLGTRGGGEWTKKVPDQFTFVERAYLNGLSPVPRSVALAPHRAYLSAALTPNPSLNAPSRTLDLTPSTDTIYLQLIAPDGTPVPIPDDATLSFDVARAGLAIIGPTCTATDPARGLVTVHLPGLSAGFYEARLTVTSPTTRRSYPTEHLALTVT